MKALSLFSGIGGLDLAAQWAEIKVKAFCEIEPFPVEVLKKRFPGVHIFNDVKTLTKESFMEVMLKNGGGMESSQPVDIIFGGFPCQDLSQAGKQVGLTGARSGLWFEMLRVISEFRPRYVVAENVRGAVNLALDTVYSGLVGEGYKVYPYVISASAVGAPHQRERLFVVGVREDVYRQYTEAMENPGCELRQGGEFSAADGVETGNRDADKPERSGGTLWSSPVASDGSCGGIISPDDTYVQKASGLFRKINRKGTDGSVGLARMVKLWPTPREFMYKDSIVDRNKGNIGEKVGGQLNPDWVGQLMGYPEGWTDLDVDIPRPWQGWPALMGEKLWRTMDASDICDRKFHCNSRGEPMLSGQVKIACSDQHPYEFPRTTTGCKDRAKRLKALGNSVVPAQAYPFFKAIAEIEKTIREAA